MIDVRIEDGIMIAAFNHGIKIDITTAQQVVALRMKMQEGKKYPVVVHVNGVISDSKNVRTFLAGIGAEGISHGAFVVKNEYEKNLIHFFLKVDAPPVPTCICSDEKEAIAWIKAQLDSAPGTL